MSRRTLLVIAGAFVALAVLAVTTRSGDDSDATPATTTTTTTAASSTTTTTTTTTSTSTTTTTTTLPVDQVAIAAVLDPMSDREIAQQLVVLGASGPDPAASIADALGDACVGGVFVTKNVGNWQPAGSLEAATAAIASTSAAAADCAVAPFITTDAEPGTRVLKVPVDPLPDPSVLAAGFADDPEAAQLEVDAERFATDLAGAGVHVNLGVIVDVDAGDGFYMDREGRSFGADPIVADVLGRALVEGHCRAGVAATLKHFPNQGATVEDPHREDSFSVNGFETWRQVGAVPYAATAAPLIMTGHIRYEGVDDGLPASLSEVITTGWLRDELGYEGVVITDDLHTMQGVGAFAPADRGVTAIAAGADLALYVATDDAAAVIDAIVERMATDPGFAEQARASAARVLRLKGALGLLPGGDDAGFVLCGGA
ncbi:MAG: glycoside hydrolase family 3 N-terminal domain-containing protein [Actinomycetota bacterium]